MDGIFGILSKIEQLLECKDRNLAPIALVQIVQSGTSAWLRIEQF
jgi:hypothetical protein